MANWLEEEKKRRAEKAYKALVDQYVKTGTINAGASGQSSLGASANALWREKSEAAAEQIDQYNAFKQAGNTANANKLATQLAGGTTWRANKLKGYVPEVSRQGYLDMLGFMNLHRNEGLWDVESNQPSAWSDSFLEEMLGAYPGKIDTSKAKDAEWAATGAQKQADYERAAANVERWKQLYEDKDVTVKDVMGDTKKNTQDVPVESAKEWYNWLMADYLLGDQEQLFDFEDINARYEAMDDETYYAEEDRLRKQFESLDWDALMYPTAPSYESETEKLELLYEQAQEEKEKRRVADLWKQMAERDGINSNIEGRLMEEIEGYNTGHIDDEGYDSTVYNPKYYTNQAYFINHATSNTNVGNILSTLKGRNIFANWFDTDVQTVNSYLEKGYNYLLPEEIVIYNDLYLQNKELAQSYLNSIESDLLARRAAIQNQELGLMATDSVLGPFMRLVRRAAPIANATQLPAQIIEGYKGTADPNASYYDFLNAQGAISEAQRAAIMEKDKTGIGAFLFDAADSVGDVLVGLGLGNVGNAALMASRAASGSLQESAERDITGLEAVGRAAGAAGIEALTEKLGVDGAPSGTTNLLKQWGRDALGEGAEELLSNIGATAMDIGVSAATGKKNTLQEAKDAYVLAGEKDPWKKVALDKAKELGTDFAMGAIAGGVIGGGKALAQKLSTRTVPQAVEAAEAQETTPASETIDSAVKATEGKVKKENAQKKNLTVKAVAYATNEGEVRGEFQRFVMKEGKVQAVVNTDGKDAIVPVEDLTDEGGAGTAAIIEYTAAAHQQMSADEANTMMTAYQQTGGDAKRFIADFEAVYAAGFADVNAPTTSMPENVASAVYEQAKREGVQEEEKRVAKAKRLRATVQPSVAWLGDVEDNSAIRGAGDVVALSGAMEGMTESQKSTVEVVQALAEELRLNVVLYRSTAKNIAKTANGKYDPNTHTVYVDVNSGAASEAAVQAARENNTLGFAMMTTLGHELTHHMESTSAEGYAAYKAAVKKQLQENGKSWAALVRGKIDAAAREGRKLTRMGAEAEVVADASEYMLQQSSFTQKLSKPVRGRVKAFVQDFMEKVKTAFAHIVGEHPESAALRKVIDGVKQYTGNLQEMWDAALGETIENTKSGKHAGAEANEVSPVGKHASAAHAGEPGEVSAPGKREAGTRLRRAARLAAQEIEGQAGEGAQMEEQFSIRDSEGNELVMNQQDLEDNKIAISGMGSVSTANGNRFVNLDGANYRRAVQGYFDDEGRIFKNPTVGEVKITTSGMKHLTRYKSTLKSALVPCVKDVIENGLVVDIDDNHAMRGEQTVVLAAPVTLDGKGYYMGVAVRQANNLDKLYHIHEAALIEREKGDHPATKTEPLQAEPSPDGHPSIYSILDSIRKYNRESVESSENAGQFSTRDLPDAVSIREYLGAMKPTNRMTETEKDLLGRYQKKLADLQEKERLAAEQDEILKKAHGDELLRAKNRYQVYRQQANRLAREMARIERAEGFAGLMATSQTIVNEYLSGAAGSVADAQDELETEIKRLTDRLKVIGNTVEGTAQGQRNAFARGLFNQAELNRAAKQLKDSYNSRMSVKVIADRLALTYGEIYANEGETGAMRFAEAAKELAQDILNSSRYRYRSETLSTIAEEMPNISLTETDLQEIKNAGLTITEYKRDLSPYVKVVEGASDLSSYVTGAEAYGGQIARILGDDTEGNLAMALYNVIQAERAEEASATFEGMSESESLGAVLTDVASVNLPMSTSDTTLEYLRKELKKYAGENEQAAQSVDAAIKAAKGATARASAVWREAVKAQGIASQAVEYYRALEEQRRLIELQEQKEILTEQMKSDAAKEIAKRVEEKRAEYKAREARAREYRHTRDDVEKLRREIGRTVKRLNALRVRETDQKHVPQELQRMVDLVMTTFTDSSLARLAFSREKTASLSKTYAELLQLESDMTYYWDDEIETELQNLSALSEAYTALVNRQDGSIPSHYSLEGVELELEILQGVRAIIGNVMNMVNSTNKAFLAQSTQTFESYANQTGEALLKKEDAKILKGALGNAQKIVDEMLRTGNMTPVYFIEHLDNPLIKKVFDQIRRGQSDYAKIIAESQAFVQETKEKYHYGSWVGDEALKLTTGQKHVITLTREQAMWAYATAKREAENKLYQTEHLLYGGFQYKDMSNIGEGKTRATDKPHQLDKADIAKISDWLTEEQKAYADAMVGYLSTVMAEYGNDASMAMFGYKKFLESYYFPFKTKADQRFLRGDEGASGENAGTGRVKNSGFTKKLQRKANQTLVMDDFTAVVADHMNRMATYSAMVQPIENLKRLLNHKVVDEDGTSSTIRALIGQKYGQTTQDYLTTLLKDLNGAAQGDERAMKGVDYLVSAFKRGAVLASTSVVLQQPTAMARAMAYISPKYFAVNPLYRPSKGTWEKMLKYSGTAIIKDMGKFDVGMGLTASQYIADEHLNPLEAYRRLKAESKGKAGMEAYKRVLDWLTAAPGKADQWTWGIIWQAAENEQAALHPEMDRNSDAFLEMVGKRFDDVIDHTQVYDSVLTRSNLMRSRNAFHKTATSFMAEPTLSLNMLYDALVGKHSGKQRAAIIGGVVASQVLAGAMAALAQAWNDDEDKRNAAEKYADRAISNITDNLNPLNMIPYVSDIMSLLQGYDVERPDMTVIADLMTYSQKFFAAFEDGGAPSWKEVENFAGTWLNLAGVPLKNISREVRRTRNAIMNSQWTAPSASNLGFIALENTVPFGLYSDKNTAYYERMVSAMVKGDEQLVEDYREYMLTSKMVTEDKLTDGLKAALKNLYVAGDVDEDAAIGYLQRIGAADSEDDAYWEVDKWSYMRETGATADSYRKYNEFFQAVESGANLKEIIKTYLDNGVSKTTLASQITSHYKQQYIDLYNAGKRTELANLQARILTAYQALGYDREEKLKDVQKWLKKKE